MMPNVTRPTEAFDAVGVKPRVRKAFNERALVPKGFGDKIVKSSGIEKRICVLVPRKKIGVGDRPPGIRNPRSPLKIYRIKRSASAAPHISRPTNDSAAIHFERHMQRPGGDFAS